MGSSTDLLLEHLGRTVAEGLEPYEQVNRSLIKLNTLTFIPCQSCGRSPAPRFCFFDGLDEVYEQLEKCDCLLFGTPVYFDSVSAQAKMFIDRCNCFRPPDYNAEHPEHAFVRRINRRRPGAMILVGGERGWFEGARRVTAGFFKWVEVNNEGMIQYASPDFNRRGRAADYRETLAAVNKLGQHLATVIRNGLNP